MGGDVANLVVTAVITGFQTGFNPYAMLAAVVLTFAAQKLAPKPKPPDMPSFDMVETDRKQSFRQAITSRKIVYGEIRVGGPIIFIESSPTPADAGPTTELANAFLHMIVLVASHEIQSFEEFYINGTLVLPSDLNADGEPTDPDSPFYVDLAGGATNSLLRIQTALGTADQPDRKGTRSELPFPF